MSRRTGAKKLRASFVAGTLAAAIALTGTFAWRSVSQTTINEFVGDRNPGGRLHDDFDGANKDVYAENFTDKKDGKPVFVRVRLEEYMEIGPDAGINRKDAAGNTLTNRDVTVLAKSRKDPNHDADINDPTTWYIHKPGDTAAVPEADNPFQEYWTWTLGGESVYMPTFNKNKDSLSVDVNGTYVGLDGSFEGGTPYDDYVAYALGDTKIDDEYFDADDDIIDEYIDDTNPSKVPGGGGVLGTNYTWQENVEHTAQATLKTTAVLTMAEWKAQGGKPGNYWVWDTDGWAYWAAPVQPQTATGLLLDSVIQAKDVGEKNYYAINVVGQFADAGNWGDKDADNDADKGFYADGMTDEAKDLLDLVSGVSSSSKVTGVSVAAAGGAAQVRAGSNLQFNATVTLSDGSSKVDNSAVTWSVSGGTSGDFGVKKTTIDQTGLLKVYVKEAQATELTVTATSKLDGSKVGEAKVTVQAANLPQVTAAAAGGVTEVEAGNTSLAFTMSAVDGDNVVITDEVKGTTKWSLATEPEDSNITIGQTDGILNVPATAKADTKITVTATVTYEEENYSGKAVLTVVGPDAITVTGPEKVKPGGESAPYQYTAKQSRNGKDYANHNVTWSLSGNSDTTGTTIDAATGVLTVGASETKGGTFKVIATSETKPSLSKEFTVKVAGDGVDLGGVTAGSDTPINIGGRDYYVLYTDISNERALILSKGFIGVQAFNSNNSVFWSGSDMQTYLRNWLELDAQKDLFEVVWKDASGQYATFYNRKDYRNASKGFEAFNDPIFLLSEADLFGTFGTGKETANVKEYTTGKVWKLTVPGGLIMEDMGVAQWWLRSIGDDRGTALVDGYGDVTNALPYDNEYTGVRPALWVKIQ